MFNKIGNNIHRWPNYCLTNIDEIHFCIEKHWHTSWHKISVILIVCYVIGLTVTVHYSSIAADSINVLGQRKPFMEEDALHSKSPQRSNPTEQYCVQSKAGFHPSTGLNVHAHICSCKSQVPHFVRLYRYGQTAWILNADIILNLLLFLISIPGLTRQ